MLDRERVDTKTDLAEEDRDPDHRDAFVLYVAFRADEPMSLPSRHVLNGVTVVEFGRGDRAAIRSPERLVLRVPDEKMSTDHGRLLRMTTGWVIEAQAAKNRILTRGIRTASSAAVPGQTFTLGHTVFLLTIEPIAADEPFDLDASALSAPVPELATFDAVLAAAFHRMALVAKKSEHPVLLLGQTGTGKEVTARALHQLSGRRGEFVAVNCGGIDAGVFASEMFGHQKGAFTGATRDAQGYVRTADHGTLFLDEIGELPLEVQTKLLRVLQEREVNPVGVALPIAVDLRLCAATNRDLPALVAAERFRHDLFSRLQGFTITLPPLRARRADLGLLIPALLRRLPEANPLTFTPAAAARLFDYDWPLNVRELASALGLMVLFAGANPIGPEHLPDHIRTPVLHLPARQATPRPRARPAAPLTTKDRDLKQQISTQLRETNGNVAEVARRLGKDRTQIYRWIHRFGLQTDARDISDPLDRDVEDPDDADGSGDRC